MMPDPARAMETKAGIANTHDSHLHLVVAAGAGRMHARISKPGCLLVIKKGATSRSRQIGLMPNSSL